MAGERYELRARVHLARLDAGSEDAVCDWVWG
jgi:hypothetical protein